MALTRVSTLAEFTDQDSSQDPDLSAALLRRIVKDIGTSCNGSNPLQEQIRRPGVASADVLLASESRR